MKRKLRLGDSYALTDKLQRFFNRLATKKRIDKDNQTQHGQRRHTTIACRMHRPSSCHNRGGILRSYPSLIRLMCIFIKVHNRYGLGTYTLRTTRIRGGKWAYLGSASELDASSELTRSTLVLLRPNQGTTESKPRWQEDQTKFPSETGAKAIRERSQRRWLPAKRNPEESCVCTLAMAPARSGLGLALGLMVTLFLTTMCLYAVQPVSAQEAGPAATAVANIKPLQIGDSIPEALWHLPLQVANHPEGKDTITLNDYRDKKLIVLDFWATWCKPCLLSLAKLDTIQTTLDEGDLAVLPVLVYDYPKNLPSFAERRGGWPWEWPTVVNDTLLNKVVLARYLTGFGTAWIAEGRLLAVPHPKAMTRENILKAIHREPLSIQNRTELPLTN